MLVHADKEGYVIDVQREPTDAMVDSAMREIRRADMPVTQTQICKGPWHYRSGKGTPLPIDQFPMNRYKPGQRTATCQECLDKSGKRLKVSEKDALAEKVKDMVNHNVAGSVHKWKVTVIRPTEEIVYAATYVDISSEVTGEIIRVERLD